MVWGSVVPAISLYSADRSRLRLAFLNNTESLKLAGKKKKSQGYCLTKKTKQNKKASKYILKTAAVAFRVCVGNGVILILISFLTAGFVVHVKIGTALQWEWEVVPTRPPCSLVLSGALSDGKVGGSPRGFFWAGDPEPLWPPGSPQAVAERQNCFGDACAAPAQGAQGRAAFPGLPAPSSALPLPPFPPKSPFPQSKPVFPSRSLNQSDVSPFPQPTR